MGWTFSTSWATRQQLLDYLVSYLRWGEKYQILHSSPRGNRHWYIGKRLADGETFIGVDLMKGGTKKEPGWGYKDLEESCGPCVYDCPISFLNIVPDPGGYATEWREKVRRHHEQKKNQLRACPNMVVELGQRRFRLLDPAGPRKGWRVIELVHRNGSGWLESGIYRMSAPQVARATRVNQGSPAQAA